MNEMITRRGTPRVTLRSDCHDRKAMMQALKDISKDAKPVVDYYSEHSVKGVDVYTPGSKHIRMAPKRFKELLINPVVYF